MTERTVRNWEAAAGRPEGRPGRPPYPPQAWWRAHRAVRQVVGQQGWTTGWRPVSAAMRGDVSDYRIQRSLAAWKRRHASRVRRHRAAHRTSVHVHGAGVIWAQDATHLGRCGRQAVQTEVLLDRGWKCPVALEVGGVATQEEVAALLEQSAEREGWPLVWQTDNGAAYCGAAVEGLLAAHRVVHLRSRCQVPQDNAVAERAIGGIKREAGLGRAVRLESWEEARASVAGAVTRLAARTVGGHGQRDQGTWSATVSRDEFYARVQAAMAAARAGETTARAKRGAEREAIWRTLEAYGLVTRTGGGTLRQTDVKPERVS